jgi:hypothetical protein
MKSTIGFCLMSLLLAGCCKHPPKHATTQPSEFATTRAAESQRADPSKPVLMEHRLVSIHVGEPSTRPTTRPNRYPAQQRWTSQTIESEFAFTELLPSWNVEVPENAGVRWDVRVRDAKSGEWSPWLYIGYWGRVTHDRRTIEFEGGEVEIDVLRLKSPADAFEIRSTGMSFELGAPVLPRVHKVQAVYSRPLEENAVVSASSPPAPVDLHVPFRPQGIEDKCISGSICSPTSVSMVMQWAGIDRPTQENALAIWDDDYSLFGNWNRAVQYAATLGLESHLERFTTMDQVRARLAEGQPIIASINFEKGTFPSNVMNSTDGHLIVIRGFTEQGDLIVNDPASKDRGNGVIYHADELAQAWLVNTGGVGYIIKNGDRQQAKTGN